VQGVLNVHYRLKYLLLNMKTELKSGQILLISGDLVTFALVTAAGFATHRELGTAPLVRILAVFLPLLAGWLAILPFSRLYDLEIVSDVRQLWRPFWAMVVCMPFAMWLRSAWLNTTVIPVFVLVMAGISALAILAWRAVFVWLGRNRTGQWTKSS
jgi:hypothetical protein